MMLKPRRFLLLAAWLCIAVATPAFCVDLFNNGPLITHPGGMTNGGDRSAIGPGGTIFGFGAQMTSSNRVADDFSNAVPWNVDSVGLFTYQTGATASTITGATLQIWNGVPGAPGSAVIFGDTTTNRMTSTSLSNIYRTTGTDNAGTTRRIQLVEVGTPGLVLNPGTYYADWNFSGTAASGPWQPPVSDPNILVAGNGLQQIGAGTAYNPALDGTTQSALPFIVRGTIVPEPAALSLLLAGVATLAFARKR